MAQVSATQSVDIDAGVDRTFAAISDYVEVRPQILPENYHDYQVLEGGKGAGTVASWTLQATKKRQRDVRATVTVSGTTLTETDANSSMVTTYEVTEVAGRARVTTTTAWNGAGGIGGFFEKTFAPKGLNKIQAQLLGNLKSYVQAHP